jgi:ATP-dependent RNA helicase DeaD
VSLGKKDGFDIRSFKDWVAASSNLSWQDLHVDVSGVYSFVDAKENHVDAIIKSLNGITYNDRPVRAEVSGDRRGGSEGGERRSYSGGGGARRSSGGERSYGGGERRSSGGGERPSYGGGERRVRERSDSAPRSEGRFSGGRRSEGRSGDSRSSEGRSDRPRRRED